MFHVRRAQKTKPQAPQLGTIPGQPLEEQSTQATNQPQQRPKLPRPQKPRQTVSHCNLKLKTQDENPTCLSNGDEHAEIPN
jgi:hypothetical protein